MTDPRSYGLGKKRHRRCTYRVQEDIMSDIPENLVRIAPSLFVVCYRLESEGFLKNGVFWDFTPCGSCKNRRFGGI
jgi:hypothetical protein